MKLRKLTVIMLLIAIFISQISFIQFNNFVYAENKQATSGNDSKFHYQQLTDLGKKFYNGIYDMYMQGTLKTGTESYDLTEKGYVTQEQLENYMKGNTELKAEMNAARYAFYADYPEIFYVNFQKLTLRVTKDAQNKYHANIGSGNLKNYYIEGFTSKEQVEEAIEAFDNRVNEIVNGVKNLKIEEGKNSIVEQIKYVHNEIIHNTSYRLESDCTEGNEGFLGTPYGSLVKKQAVCEGYARALKTILDRLEIHNILVQGTHQSDGAAAVPHMWNYVEIEKETNARASQKVWYAIDSTLDDPFLRDTTMDPTHPDFVPGSDIQEGFENTRYCMVGTETMQIEHTALGTVEAAGNYTFKYPELNVEDYGIDNVTNNNGLLVKFKQDGTETEEYKAGDFYISYNNKGYAEAAKEGKYLLVKYHEYKPGDDLWIEGKWGYLNPELYAPGAFNDNGDHMYLSVPNSEYMEFAVTTLEPSEGLAGYTYQGDESDFVAQSGKLYNPNGIYIAPPYIKHQTPVATASLTVGPTYHVDVTYTDDLVLADGATEAGYRMESTGATGVAESKIENFTFDGKNRITFDLTFSKMFADDDAMYRIYITGLVGKNSNKEPNYISYGAYNLIACSYSMNAAKSWNVFARPTLLENEDLSLNGWQTSDGQPVSEKLKSRIALVTTRTTQVEKDSMNNLMEEQLGDKELITSETYNISLNVCKKYVVKTGHRLRLSLGFPAGYGPDDAGVTFKAYHFKRDAEGNVTGVEEIPCVVTQYGLIVTCDSFSPFAIAVTENDGTAVQEKAVIVSDTEGGVINGANREEGNIITLKENESKTLNVVPNEGYEIESITKCGDAIEVTNKDVMNITINYNDVKDGNCIVETKFVAKTIVEEEVEKGETVVQPTAVPAQIIMPEGSTVTTINKKIEITPTVSETEGIQTYQWYKEGKKLEGKTNQTLTIDSTKKEDSGDYILKVTTTVGTTSVETTSEPYHITVRSFETAIESADKTQDLQNLKVGDEFIVNLNIKDLKDVENGFVSLMGQLQYNTNLLERISLEGQNGWQLDENSLNEQNFKFITDNDHRVTEPGTIVTLKFKVRDQITETTQEKIKIVGISASGGDGEVASKDLELAINILKTEKQEGITSKIYKIEKDYISKITPGTTANKFKQNVSSEQEITFLDKDGNKITDTTVLGTGMTLKVGSTLQYTLVVTGDIDGDAEITINDMAKLKLHLIDYELLTDARLKAADVDYDKDITVNDMAQIKLVLLNLMVIK